MPVGTMQHSDANLADGKNCSEHTIPLRRSLLFAKSVVLITYGVSFLVTVVLEIFCDQANILSHHDRSRP